MNHKLVEVTVKNLTQDNSYRTVKPVMHDLPVIDHHSKLLVKRCDEFACVNCSGSDRLPGDQQLVTISN